MVLQVRALSTAHSNVHKSGDQSSGDIRMRKTHRRIFTVRDVAALHTRGMLPPESVLPPLQGLVNVAAIDCDAEAHKKTCSKYGVKGFPTLKVIFIGACKF